MIHLDYILIGTGSALIAAAQSIREQDRGRILILNEEPQAPCQLPLSRPFSKWHEIVFNDASGIGDACSRKSDIVVCTGGRATGLDTLTHIVTLQNGERLHYGKLLLASGVCPRAVTIPGGNAANVLTLCGRHDSPALREAMVPGRRLTVMGAGYIGMEVAAAAIQRGVRVTVITPDCYPLSRFASDTLGGFVRKYLGQRGVRFITGDGVVRIETDGMTGRASSVCLRSGRAITVDFVVVDNGVDLNLGLAQSAGLKLDPGEGVFADEYLQTSAHHVYVAGDIARFKDSARQPVWSSENPLNAQWQGSAAGRNMAGKYEAYNRIAGFRSDLLDFHLIVRGNPERATSKMVLGDLENGEFIELYGDAEDVLRMGVAVSKDETRLAVTSEALARLLQERATIVSSAARLQNDDRLSILGLPSMAAVLGILMGTEAPRFSVT